MKWKVFIGALILSGMGFGCADPGSAQKKEDLPKKAAEGNELAKMGKARLDAAEKAYKAWFAWETGAGLQGGLVYQLSVQWLEADLELTTKKEERTAAYAAHLERMKKWGEESKMGMKDQGEHPYLLVTDSCRKEAEFWLAKERAEK